MKCMSVWVLSSAATVGGWLLQMILRVAATATQLELLSPLILGLHVMWKTPWACSTSSSDDRGFTCQLVFIIPSRFVVYSTEFNLSYVKYFPIAVFLFIFYFLFFKGSKKNTDDYILFCSFWIKSNAACGYIASFFKIIIILRFVPEHSSEHARQAQS